jgi:hypothetical protein
MRWVALLLHVTVIIWSVISSSKRCDGCPASGSMILHASGGLVTWAVDVYPCLWVEQVPMPMHLDLSTSDDDDTPKKPLKRIRRVCAHLP